MLDYVAPIFMIILIGAFLKRLPQESFPKVPLSTMFPAFEWLCFYVAFPALLFSRTATLEINYETLTALAGLVFVPIFLVLFFILIGLAIFKTIPDPARSSVVQGSIRPSAYFGLGVAGLAFPEQEATLVIIALALALPVTNVISVIALSWWSGKCVSSSLIVKNILKNPTIIGTMVGVVYNILDVPLPLIFTNALNILGNIALGLGLLCVGAGLELHFKGKLPWTMIWTNSMKMILLPFSTYLICTYFGVDSHLTLAVCFYASLPAAPNTYIMARQMGGDASLMALIVTSQALLAMFTVPIWLSIIGTRFVP